MAGERTAIRKRKYLVLILTLVGVLIVESSPRRIVLGPVLSDALLALVTFTVFLAVFQGWHQRAVALATAVAVTAVNWSRHLSAMSEHEVLRPMRHYGLMVGFLGFAVSVILRHILTREAVTGDELLSLRREAPGEVGESAWRHCQGPDSWPPIEA